MAVIALGTAADLRTLLAALVPATQEYRVEVVVIARSTLEAGVEAIERLRVVTVGSDSSEEAMRRRGLQELDTDLVVFTTDREPQASDWPAILPRLSQVVVSREEEISRADWLGVLRRVGAAEPGA